MTTQLLHLGRLPAFALAATFIAAAGCASFGSSKSDEDRRSTKAEIRDFWLSDQKSETTYEMVHGGIGP